MSAHPVQLDKLSFRPGKGLSATSEDGKFQMNLGVRAQYRLEVTQENEPGLDDSMSVQLRRARFTSTGHFYTPKIKYKMELAVSPRDVSQSDGVVGTSPLLDFYVDMKAHRDLTVRVGQYKVPFNRQRVISSGKQMLVDRAITNSEFNMDRDIGLDLRSSDLFGLDLLRYYLGVYGGNGRNSNDTDDFGMFYLARVEVLPFGLFKDYDEVDFARTGPRLSLGLAHAFVDDATNDRGVRGAEPTDGGTSDVNVTTLDLMFKAYGFSLQTETFLRRANRNPGDAVDENGAAVDPSPSRDGSGFMVQAGYLLPGLPLQAAARFARVKGRDGLGENGLSDSRELGFALGYFPARHQLKLQADYERVGSPDNFSEAEDRFRLQMQVAF